jgi:hypothetical protein
MPTKLCHRLKAPPGHGEVLQLAKPAPEEAFLVTGYKKKTGKRKEFPVGELNLAREDLSMEEGPSREFIKDNDNSVLYQAQLLRSCTTGIKTNAWVRDLNINLKAARSCHKKTWADSKVRGFMWLFTSHALPVGTRLRGKGANTPCPLCTGTEDIEHMAFKCPHAQGIRKAVALEWWARTNDARWSLDHTFKEAFFGPTPKEALEVAWLTLTGITTWHIWRIRCAWAYDRKEVIPIASTTNAIWHDFESALLARCTKAVKQLEKLSEDVRFSRVSAEKAASMRWKIELEASAPSAILPLRLLPTELQQGANHLIEEWFSSPPGESTSVRNAGLDRPITNVSYCTKWRLTTASPAGRTGSEFFFPGT